MSAEANVLLGATTAAPTHTGATIAIHCRISFWRRSAKAGRGVRGTPISTWTTAREGRRSSRVMAGTEARDVVLLRKRVNCNSLTITEGIGKARRGSPTLEYYVLTRLDYPGAH